MDQKDTSLSVTLRAATAADQPRITQLVRAAHLNPIRLAWPNFLVAERIEAATPHVVGVGQLRPHKDGSVELASLVVVAEARHTGVGSQLVNALIGKADRPLYLMCESSKVTYYQRFGFYKLTNPLTMPRSLRRFYRLATTIERIAAVFGKQPGQIAIMGYPGLHPATAS